MTTPFIPPLQVDPSHLQDLADQHSDIAVRIGQATPLTDGVAEDVKRSHGTVCQPVWSALADAEGPRKEACLAMQAMSDLYSMNLSDAAKKYVRTDEESAGAIGEAHQ